MAKPARRPVSLALLSLFATAAFCLLPAASHAQTYPDRVVRIVVPFPAGGSNDVIARLLAQKLSERLGQQFVIENRAGAGGNTGADSVAKSPPDGYTLLLSAPGPLVVNQTLYGKLNYDPAKDLAPVALIASVPIVLMVNPAVPAAAIVRSWGEFVPDTLNIAEIARQEALAAKLVDEVQFND